MTAGWWSCDCQVVVTGLPGGGHVTGRLIFLTTHVTLSGHTVILSFVKNL